MKACALCGTDFEPNFRAVNRQRYCSPACGKKGAPSYNRGRSNPWTERPCAHCGVVFQRAGKTDGARRYCSKACKNAAASERFYDQRWRHLARRYGVTPETFEKMFAAQEGRCAICSLLLGGRALETDSPQVDHDHLTGKPRAILCRPCNTALGMFRDDAATVERAAEYLRFWATAHAAAPALRVI